MTTRKQFSTCNVKFLGIAAQAAYRLKKNNLIDPAYSESYAKTLQDITDYGYEMKTTISPKGSGGTGETSLAAACFVPTDDVSPVVISFRGTKMKSDILSDIRLGSLGVVQKEFRDDAFAFYKKARKEFLDREIILTGHSLGGHLAQYVGAKAYQTDNDLIRSHRLQVRTFNTAPINTAHSDIFKKAKGLLSRFVNYRLSPDIVSDLPLQKYYGNTFVFPCKKWALASHSMGAVIDAIPDEILAQKVGTISDKSRGHNALVELVRGVKHSYQCRVENQFFSRFRAGTRNLAKMDDSFPSILEHVQNGKYGEAIYALKELRKNLDGQVSTDIVDTLIVSTMRVELRNDRTSDMKQRLNKIKQEDQELTSESDVIHKP